MIARAQMKSGGNRSQVIGLSQETFNELEKLASSVRSGSKQFQQVMNVGAQALAKATQGEVERLYRGPQSNPMDARRGGGGGQAWTIPVRRITGQTQRSWRVKMVAFGAWEVFSQERGAYMVEFGIVRGGGGKPRPILRMSGNQIVRMISTTQFGKRVMAGTFGELQMNRGQFSKYGGRMEGQVYQMTGARR